MRRGSWPKYTHLRIKKKKKKTKEKEKKRNKKKKSTFILRPRGYGSDIVFDVHGSVDLMDMSRKGPFGSQAD